MTGALPHEVAGAYLRLADEEAPGLVEGLYLVGSVALGEFRAHTGDVDFLAVTPRWHRILDESPRIRGRTHPRSLYRNPFTRRRDLIGFWDALVDDARRTGGHVRWWEHT